MKPKLSDLLDCTEAELAEIGAICIGLIALHFDGKVYLPQIARTAS